MSEESPPQGTPGITIRHLNPPKYLEIDGSGVKERWKEWKQAWERYILLSGVDKQEKKFQSALLLHSIGPDSVRIYNGMSFGEDEDKDDPSVLMKKFDVHFLGEARDFIERMKFNRRKQKNEESFETFLTALRNLAKTCEFCKCSYDQRIMDRIIEGHKSEKVRDKLTGKSKLDLQTVLNICRAMEMTEDNVKVVKNENPEMINKLSVSQNKGHSTGGNLIKCKFCMYSHEASREKCAAWGKTCNVCGKTNHFAKSAVCGGRSKPASKPGGGRRYPARGKKYSGKTRVHAVDEVQGAYGGMDSDSTEGSICQVTESISTVNDPQSRPLYCKMTIDGVEVTHQVDPGATVCVIPVKHVADRSQIRREKVVLKMWNGNSLQALGRCKIKVRNPATNKKWNIDYVLM